MLHQGVSHLKRRVWTFTVTAGGTSYVVYNRRNSLTPRYPSIRDINFWLKRVFNEKLNGFDSLFLKEIVSLNIFLLKAIGQTFITSLGLAEIKSGQSTILLTANINVLGRLYLADEHHRLVPGRYMAHDGFAQGLAKLNLRGGQVKIFIDHMSRTLGQDE